MFLTFCVTFLSASPAVADEISAAEVIRLIDKGGKVPLAFIHGQAAGLGWANATLKNQGRPLLFCQPEMLAINPEQAVDIMRDYLMRHPEHSDFEAGLILLAAHKEVFPCGSVSPIER